MIHIVQYDNSYQAQLFDFLRIEANTSDQAASNMWHDDWQNHPNTLPYKLIVTEQFNNGVFNLAFDNDKIVGCSGAYVSTFNEKIVIAGSRTWVTKSHRNMRLPREHFLPKEKAWATERNMNIIALTFNEYNKNLITTFKRMRLGETRSTREPKHIFFNNMFVVPFPVNIQYTKQYVAYERLTNWDFDWKSIEWHE